VKRALAALSVACVCLFVYSVLATLAAIAYHTNGRAAECAYHKAIGDTKPAWFQEECVGRGA
jgi:hypothetical protein